MDKLVEECTNLIDENNIFNETLHTISSNYYCVSCTPYIISFAVFLATSVVISGVFVYFYYWRSKNEDHVRPESKKEDNVSKYNLYPDFETKFKQTYK